MIASLMLGFREALEATLIVSVVAASLRRNGMTNMLWPMWLGVATAVAVSLGVGAALSFAGLAFEGQAEALFEGVLMLFAAGVISWVIVWMRSRGQQQGNRIAEGADTLARQGTKLGLFGLVFVAVVREGIELAIFLLAARFSVGAPGVLGGAAIGIAGAVVLGVLIYSGSVRLSLKAFFRVTTVLLVFVAAGLFAHGIHELQEAGIIPIVIEHVWNLNPILDEGSIGGQLLKALFGYNGNPSLLEVLSFAGYLAVAVLAVTGLRRRHES